MVSDIKIACEASHADGLCKRQTTVCAFCAAGHLIDRGWRREEEVVKKVLHHLYKLTVEPRYGFSLQPQDIVKIAKEDFGVEVEE